MKATEEPREGFFEWVERITARVLSGLYPEQPAETEKTIVTKMRFVLGSDRRRSDRRMGDRYDRRRR